MEADIYQSKDVSFDNANNKQKVLVYISIQVVDTVTYSQQRCDPSRSPRSIEQICQICRYLRLVPQVQLI